MADIFIYNLTTIGGVDPSNDWMIIEDTSTGETKKIAPGSLPVSTATQTALDGKVDENASITGATKTKITYDSKGLVTAGADLAASDMPSGIDANKIGAGLVDNTEFSYLNGVSSAIQTQLNAKQGTLTLTTTGSSGPATLIGNTLNIPQYSGGGGGGVVSLEGLSGALQLAAGSGISITDNGTDTITITNTGGGGGSVAWGSITGTLSNQTDLQTQLDSKTNKIITANRQAASYTLVASDADKLVEMNVGSANDLTIPASTFSAGQQILLAQYGAGQTTIVAGAGMTIRSNGGKLKLSGQYSGATLVFLSASECYLFGDITA